MLVKAYAKINLTLDIISKRADGYHLLDSAMQTVSLHDTVSVKKYDKITVFCDDGSLCGEDNLAFKAAQNFFAAAGIIGGAKINIKKRIPVSAGLGGGSSDAAAVIVALDKLYGTKFSDEKLNEIALSIGADVPFLLNGGTARVGGIGEEIIILKPIEPLYVLLVKNGEKQSTTQMYQKIDSITQEEFYTERFVNSLNNGLIDYSAVQNAFLSVSNSQKAIDILNKTNALAVSLSGSGPTVFSLYKNKREVKAAAKTVKANGLVPIIAKLN